MKPGHLSFKLPPFKRWMQFLLAAVFLTSLTAFNPTSPQPQDADSGYWDLFDITQEDTWLGDKYRGMEAVYEPFYEGDFTMGAVYEEKDIVLNPEAPRRIFINERAFCTLGGFDPEKQRLLLPGTAVPMTLSVQGSLVGKGLLKEVQKAGLRFRSLDDTSVSQNILYVESFQDKTTEENMVDAAPKTTSGKWIVPMGNKPGEVRSLEFSCFVAGGIVQIYKNYKYRWTAQETSSDVDPNAPAAPAGPQAPVKPSDTPDPLCKPPYGGSPEDKLKEILRQYYIKIPKGVYSSGSQNNLMSWIPGYQKADDFVCGEYQRKIILWLESIKFDPDPCVSGLLDDYDFGPIQAWFRGHQAVVLYRKGENWLVSGLVLDPWMNQKPEVYTIKKWSAMWSTYKNYGGIGPSIYFSNNYPTHGGNYVNPGGSSLSKDQEEYIKSMPKDKRDSFFKMTSTEKLNFLRRHEENIRNGNKYVAHSPLTIYVVDAEGRRTGLVNGELVREIPDAAFSLFPLADGTQTCMLEYPPVRDYTLVATGTGTGEGHLFSTFRSPNNPDEEAVQSFYYTFPAEQGGEYRLDAAEGSDLTTRNGPVAAKALDASAETLILSLPAIAAPEPYTPGQPLDGEEAGETAGGVDMYWGLGAGLACLCALGAAALVAVGLVLARKRKKRPAA